MNKVAMIALVGLALASFAAASCPNSCSGHGRCGKWSKCTCFYRWTGNDCSQRLCKEGLAWVDGSDSDPHSWAECSNKGLCNRDTGECECYDQYDGAACERSVCPNDCSGHGTCEYIEDLSTYASSNWDHHKIQGCRCDGDWTGTDCSQRICPWGDDPITIPTSSTSGDAYTISITSTDDFTGDFFLEIDDLNGVTHRSRAFEVNTIGVDSAPTAAQFEAVLLDLPAIHEVSSVGVDVSTTAGTVVFSFQLEAPLRLNDLRVRYDECTDAGCYPMLQAFSPVGGQANVDVSFVIASADNLAESAECSNRGTCDYDTGMCQCFEGHFGLACERQTILV